MLEELPKKLPEEIENRETKPLPEYRLIKREILGRHWDGSKTEQILECNSYIHRRYIDKISYDENGEVIMADYLSEEKLVPCDYKHS